MHHRHISRLVLLVTFALHEVRAHEPDLIAGEQPEIFLRRLLHEILSLDIKFPAKGHLSGTERLVLRVIHHGQPLRLPFRVIVDNQFDRVSYRHDPGPFHFQILSDAILKHGVFRRGICLGHAAQFHKKPDRLRRETASAERRDGNQSGIIPTVHNAVLHQFLDISLACDHIGQIHFRKFYLLRRMRILQFRHHPVVERSVILKLQRTDGMGNPLDRVLYGMRIVVHRVNAPLIPRILVGQMCHAVQNRIAHIDVRGGHVDFRAQGFLPVRVLSFLHLLKQPQVLLHAALPVRVVLSRLRQRPAVLAHLIRRQVGHIRLAFFYQLNRAFIHLVEIIGRKEKPFLIIRSQPLHIGLDRLHELALLLGGVRVVKTHIELSAILGRQPVIKQYALGMSDMQITVGLGRKPRMHGVVNTFRKILIYNLLNEIFRFHLFSLLCL